MTAAELLAHGGSHAQDIALLVLLVVVPLGFVVAELVTRFRR